MADFIPSVPVRAAFQLFKPEPIVRGFLLLAQDVLKHPMDAESLREIAIKQNTNIFLDNGVVELGYPLPADELVAACEVLHPDHVFPPDVIGDWEQTAELTFEFIVHLQEYRKSNDIGIMKIIQMPIIEDRATRITKLREIHTWWCNVGTIDPGFWAIPRALRGYREEAVRVIQSWNDHRLEKFHYLGFRNDEVWYDIHDCRDHSGIITLDSGKPAAAGQDQVWLTGSNYEDELRGREVPPGYWDANMLTRAAAGNITFINGLLQHG